MERKINYFFIIGILSVLVLSLNLISAQESSIDEDIYLHIFYGKGCSHCGKALDFLDSVSEKYPQLIIEKHETYFNQEERDLFEKVVMAFGEEIEGVPTIFIDNKVFVETSDSL